MEYQSNQNDSDKNNDYTNSTKNNTPIEEEPLIGVDKKLADLMMRGWVLLAESCPIDSCGCPLMRNLEGQKYCCGCEMWHFDKERPVKQKFAELVSLKGKQNVQIKPNTQHTEVSKITPKKNIDFNMNMNGGVLQALQLKLAYLANQLNSEVDLTKTKQILENINLCLNNMELAKNFN